MKDIRVVIAEDDQYSCDLMSFLLTRDRCIQVLAEGVDAMHLLESRDPTVLGADVILLDTELPWEKGWALTLIRRLRPILPERKLVCTGTAADATVLRKILAADGNGYVLKDEVHYALGEAVVKASIGGWIATPTIAALARRRGISLPATLLIINGTRRMDQLEDRDLTIARLCLLFNQPYKDVADELGISPGHVADRVTELYDKLGLNAIIEGRVSPEQYFDDAEVLALFHNAVARRQENPTTRADMKTLAFHLLTAPTIEE